MEFSRHDVSVLNILAAAIFGFIFTPNLVSAADVLINEIAWMGSETSYNDEWIELHNSSDSEIDLTGWQLNAADGSPEIQLSGTILAKNFYLLERTNDSTVPDINADTIYKGSLGNNGESLRLYDNTGAIIDAVESSSGWIAGDNASKQTMERVNANSWRTSQLAGGTPKSENDSGIPAQTQVKPQTKNQLREISLAPPQTAQVNSAAPYADSIKINEMLPSPEGSDAEEEWVELFNKDTFAADLSGWQITDTIGSITIYTFPQNTILESNDFLVLSRPTSGITLNNNGDGLQLKRPDGSIADHVSFPSASKNQSYGRGPEDWGWSNTPTPGAENIFTSKESQSKPITNLTRNSILEKQEEINMANITGSLQNSELFIFLSALALALLSGIIMVILKIKLTV